MTILGTGLTITRATKVMLGAGELGKEIIECQRLGIETYYG